MNRFAPDAWEPTHNPGPPPPAVGPRFFAGYTARVGEAAKTISWDDLWEQLENVPEDAVGEIVDGEIRTIPRPDPPHLVATKRIASILDFPFELGRGGPGGWVILPEPRVRFDDQVRVPDLAGWRADRYEEPKRGPYLVTPDWICEVLSPSTASVDREEKMPLYARCRVSHLWMVDPVERSLEVYRRESEQWTCVATHTGDVHVCAEPFEAIALDLGLLWHRGPG